jgi:fumarate hydratase subunit alpha
MEIRYDDVADITKNIKEMCMEANFVLSEDMKKALENAKNTEHSPIGKKVLGDLEENLAIADKERIPICQDTGMAVVFIEIGQRVHFQG